MAKRNFIRIQTAVLLVLLAMMACIIGSAPTPTPNASLTETAIYAKDSFAATKDAGLSLTQEAADPVMRTATLEPTSVELADGLVPRPDFEFDPCSLLEVVDLEAVTGPLESDLLPDISVGEGMPDPIQVYGCYYFFEEKQLLMTLVWVPTEEQAREIFEISKADMELLGETVEDALLSDQSFWSSDADGASATLSVQRANVSLTISTQPEPDVAARQAIELIAEQILLSFVGVPQE